MTDVPPMPPPPDDDRPTGPPRDPGAVAAEAHTLGALLIGGDVEQARQILPMPDDQFGWLLEGHAVVWQAICDVHDAGDPTDTIHVLQRLRDVARLDVAGGPVALTDLAAAAPAPSTAPSWAATVADRAHRRRMHRAALAVIEACADMTQDPASAIVELDAILDAAPTQGGLQLVTGDRLHLLPDPEWLVDARMQRGLTVVWGHPKCGKSFIALDLAAARAAGNRWHGHTCRPGRTLYVAGEGLHDVKVRLQAAFDLRAVPTDRRSAVAVTSEPLDLTVARDLARLDQAIADHRADLVILDTWARVSGVTDENDNAEASTVIAGLDRIRHRHDVDLIVVHHARKDGQTLRGASALLGALDTAVRVSKDGDMVTATASDTRGGPEWTRPIEWRLRPVGKAAVLELPSHRTAPDDIDASVARVVAALQSGPVMQSVIRKDYGNDVLRAVKQHPQAQPEHDESGRPVIVLRDSPL